VQGVVWAGTSLDSCQNDRSALAFRSLTQHPSANQFLPGIFPALLDLLMNFMILLTWQYAYFFTLIDFESNGQYIRPQIWCFSSNPGEALEPLGAAYVLGYSAAYAMADFAAPQTAGQAWGIRSLRNSAALESDL
jgi:hypothetical protein